MILRTFLRTLFNSLLTKNPVIDVFVNFCYKTEKVSMKPIKFDKNIPISYSERKNNIFFQSVSGDSIDCKW